MLFHYYPIKSHSSTRTYLETKWLVSFASSVLAAARAQTEAQFPWNSCQTRRPVGTNDRPSSPMKRLRCHEATSMGSSAWSYFSQRVDQCWAAAQLLGFVPLHVFRQMKCQLDLINLINGTSRWVCGLGVRGDSLSSKVSSWPY